MNQGMDGLEVFDPEGSILFLGSGFSSPAKNISGTNPPVGNGLKSLIVNKMTEDYSDYDLETVASLAAEEVDLYQVLYENFTIDELSHEQLEILRFPWHRIYTTNYDDAIEVGLQRLGRRYKRYSQYDPRPNKLNRGDVVHLHGSIHDVDEGNALKHIVLTEEGYVKQYFDDSEWFDEFSKDVRFATNCFFLGYKLKDYKLAALLAPIEGVGSKTFFVNRSRDAVFEKRVKDYGRVGSIGLDGFLKVCQSLPKAKTLKDPYKLKGVRFVDPHKDRQTTSKPTASEVKRLMTIGAFNEKRCLSSLPEPSYVVPRTAQIEEAVGCLSSSKTLLVSSHLGNGKTVFLSILAHKLSEQGKKCFWFKSINAEFKKELEVLSELDEEVVLLFDSYDLALSAARSIADIGSDFSMVVAVRTGIRDIRMHEISERLPKPISKININYLSPDDKSDFAMLLDEAGLLGGEYRGDIVRCDDVREIVTTLYKHREIHEKLTDELEPILKDNSLRKAVIAAHLIKYAGYDVEPAFLQAVSSSDPFIKMAALRNKGESTELVRISEDGLQAHSAVFSEYLVSRVFDDSDVVDVVRKIVAQAVRRKPQREYNAISSYFMQYNNLKSIVDGKESTSLLSGLFDELRSDTYVNSEPLFWLQYSIMMMDTGELSEAEVFLETAYSRSEAKANFKNYQLDTHALRIYLLIEAREEKDEKVGRFSKIVDKMQIVTSMLYESSHRHYVLRVLEEIVPFVNSRRFALNKDQAFILYDKLSDLEGALVYLSSLGSDYKGVGNVVDRVVESKKLLKDASWKL